MGAERESKHCVVRRETSREAVGGKVVALMDASSQTVICKAIYFLLRGRTWRGHLRTKPISLLGIHASTGVRVPRRSTTEESLVNQAVAAGLTTASRV